MYSQITVNLEPTTVTEKYILRSFFGKELSSSLNYITLSKSSIFTTKTEYSDENISKDINFILRNIMNVNNIMG